MVTSAEQCCLGSRNVCIVNDIIVRNVILLKRGKKKNNSPAHAGSRRGICIIKLIRKFQRVLGFVADLKWLF